MKQEQMKNWESEIYLVSPDAFEKRLLIASLLYRSNMDTIVINGREIHLTLAEGKNDTAEGAENISGHIMEMNTVEMYGDIDSAFRRVKNGKMENTLSLHLRSVKDLGSETEDTLCGRLKINGITDSDLFSQTFEEKIPRTAVFMLDAEKIVKRDDSDNNFFLDTLRTFLKCSSGLAVVTAVGRAEKYFNVFPEGSEAELIQSAKKLYPMLFELIDSFMQYEGGVVIHKETAYAAANKDIKKLYNANGHGALLDSIEYMPWGIDETLKKMAYCSAYVDFSVIDRVIKENEDLLLRRIGTFQHGNVRAHINVAEARKRLSRYLIYRYPLDNSLKYFADTL